MSYQSAQVDCTEQTTFVHDTSSKKSMWKIAGALAGAMCVGTVLLASGSQEKVVAAGDNIDTLFSAALTASPIMTKASLATRRAQFAQGRSMRSQAMAPRPRAVTQRAVTMMAHGHDSRKFFVGGNWKCNGCEADVEGLVSMLNEAKVLDDVDVIVCPPAIHLKDVRKNLNAGYSVCAQDVSLNDQGAFTGDISADMLTNINIKHALVGHSERRTIHGEKDEETALKAKKALAQDMQVIACIGETLEEREAEKTMDILFRQLTPFKDMYTAEDWENTVIAYEPVWAIGTGLVATPAQAEEVHKNVREWLKENVSEKAAKETRIIYGGSVNEGNAAELGANPDIDGFLVGGASLKPAFVDIINAAPEE